jgi:predicted AAA+ superfamily ATPase
MIFESITFKRLKKKALIDSLKKERSFVLFGPRQTGKSTLLEEIFAEIPKTHSLRYYLQLPSTRERLEEDPEILIREVNALELKKPVYLFIDEIQKVPKVLDVLQFLIDNKKAVLAATGSSARKMKTLGANWLPGRIHLEYLYPLTWEEKGLLESPEKINEILLFGSLPKILSQKDSLQREADLSAYTHLYLEEEIRLEALTRNVPRFNKFLRLSALESGTAPNFSRIGKEIGLTHTTIREYFQILEDTLITHRIDAFGSKRDTVLRSSRYCFFDIGVRNAAADIGHSKGILTLQFGTLFEHFIILELLACLKHKARFYYWRTKQGKEIDLVIEQRNHFTALEIKATRNPSFNDFKGLWEFSRKYSCKDAYLICQIPRVQKFGSFLAIPWFEIHNKLGLSK